MAERDLNPMDQAGESWNWLVQTAAAVLLLVGTGLLLRYYEPEPNHQLQDQVQLLNQQVQLLKQEQAMRPWS